MRRNNRTSGRPAGRPERGPAVCRRRRQSHVALGRCTCVNARGPSLRSVFRSRDERCAVLRCCYKKSDSPSQEWRCGSPRSCTLWASNTTCVSLAADEINLPLTERRHFLQINKTEAANQVRLGFVLEPLDFAESSTTSY
jgi:hypothetical protein